MNYKEIIEFCREHKRQIIGLLLIMPLVVYIIYIAPTYLPLSISLLMLAVIGWMFLYD